MLKRLWFAAPGHGSEPPWRRALAARGDARPLRVTESSALPDLEADPPWERLGTAWFIDDEHLRRFDRWAGAADTETLVATEEVVRGAAWLDRRWASGDDRLKHLALARRRRGLAPEELSERWRAHAGTVGPTPIPDRARGQAYVQDHPVPRREGEWPYDAVTEVWFDDVAALQERIAWLGEALAGAAPDDLFGERRLFAAREVLLLPG